MKRILKLPLLARILIAIALGVALGCFAPLPAVRVMATFNGIFSNFLQYLVPLIIIGLVTPAIGEIGRGAGKLLALTALIAYGDTLFAGFFSYFSCANVFPHLIPAAGSLAQIAEAEAVAPFFSIAIPPMADVMTALVFSFTLGLGMAFFDSPKLKGLFGEFRDIVVKTIEVVILPLLPLYIFGIFMQMAFTGQAVRVLSTFVSIIGVIFGLHVVLLVVQYLAAGLVSRRHPMRSLWRMMPAYFTALGTSSSAATIPVTLRQTVANGVRPEIAGFVVPLCATIHLSGSTLKIVACAVALMLMQGQAFDAGMFGSFIMMLGVMMVAAPGVPGGAIMAALGVLQSMLGFDQGQQALMIALYITMDSFGTACNVTGDGAIAMVVDRLAPKRKAAPAADDSGAAA